MDNEVKVKWVKALRSGEYQQTRFKLTDGKAYCCLGVLCKALDETPLNYEAVYDILSEDQSAKCMNLNDMERWNFQQIADYVEANF